MADVNEIIRLTEERSNDIDLIATIKKMPFQIFILKIWNIHL